MARVGIVGAGAAGLSALKVFGDAGHETWCWESSDRVGGHWNTDYEALHLITSRDTTHFEGFPMPAEYPHFPRRTQVLDYINSYATEMGLRSSISFNTRVEQAQPREGGWSVTTSAETVEVDALVVANGHLWDPKVPQVPGTFAGTTIHSGRYRSHADIVGERVLVVGSGNSGCDIAADLAQHRYDVDIVVRRGVYFQPKSYFGRPRQEVSWLHGFTPAEQDLLQRLLSRVVLGENDSYPGLPMPEAATLAGGATTVNSLLLYWIQHGRIAVQPAIESFDGHRVNFADGRSGEYDTIVWATGFNSSLPFLDRDAISWGAASPFRTAGGILPVGAEHLYFVGLIAPRGPQIPVYGVQAHLVQRMLALKEERGSSFALADHFAQRQSHEQRVDIPRDQWNEQMADTERILTELESGR